MDIKPDPYRYLNWLLFFLAASINSVPTQAFSGVSPIISQVYDISEVLTNAQSLIYPFSYIFLLLPANYIIDKKGLKMGTLFCEACMIVGLLTRLLINVNMAFMFLGTFLCSLGFCFMISGANSFANVWFPHHQIFLVSSICIFGIFTSDALGTFMSSYFIREGATKDDVFSFLLWESIIMIIIHVLNALFFRGKPKNIQNYASAVERNSFKEDLREILHNRNYKILFTSMTFVFGAVSLMFVFLPWTTKTYHYQSVYNGYIILSANMAGCLGCIAVGFIGKSFSYKKKTLFLSIPPIFAYSLIWGSFELESPILSIAAGGIYGFFTYPFLTTLTDFATQTTFPVGEGTSSGILLFGGQFGGVVISLIFSFIFDGQSLVLTRILCGFMILLLTLGMVTILFSKEILKREEYQNSKEKESLLEPNTDQ